MALRIFERLNRVTEMYRRNWSFCRSLLSCRVNSDIVKRAIQRQHKKDKINDTQR